VIRSLASALAGIALICAASWAALNLILSSSETRLAAALEENAALAGQQQDLAGRVAALEAASDRTGLPADMVWPGSSRSETELALQAAILGAAEIQGLPLFSYGAATSPAEVKSGTTGYQIEGEAPWTLVLKFLAATDEIRPRLAISEMSLRQAPVDPVAPTEARVAFRLVFWVFGPVSGAAP
jgi:hypothetical protein